MGSRHSCVQIRAVSKNNCVMGWLDMRRWAFRYTTLHQRGQYFPSIIGKTRFRYYSEDEESSPIFILAGDTCPDSPSRLEVLSHSTHLLDTHSTFFLALFSIYFLSPTLSAPRGRELCNSCCWWWLVCPAHLEQYLTPCGCCMLWVNEYIKSAKELWRESGSWYSKEEIRYEIWKETWIPRPRGDTTSLSNILCKNVLMV